GPRRTRGCRLCRRDRSHDAELRLGAAPQPLRRRGRRRSQERVRRARRRTPARPRRGVVDDVRRLALEVRRRVQCSDPDAAGASDGCARPPRGHMIPLAFSFQSFGHADFWIGVGIVAGVYSIFTLGLQVNVGFTGILNFGQAGFMAVGAYSMALLILEAHWSPWAALPVATLITMASGLLIGIPALRLPPHYLAMATISAAQIVQIAAQNATGFTGGNEGLIGFDARWQQIQSWSLGKLSAVGLGEQYELPLFLLTWLSFLVLLVVLRMLQHTPWGRVLRAIREDEDAAAALGKNVYAYKLQ